MPDSLSSLHGPWVNLASVVVSVQQIQWLSLRELANAEVLTCLHHLGLLSDVLYIHEPPATAALCFVPCICSLHMLPPPPFYFLILVAVSLCSLSVCLSKALLCTAIPSPMFSLLSLHPNNHFSTVSIACFNFSGHAVIG